jgi:hypothetical protein
MAVLTCDERMRWGVLGGEFSPQGEAPQAPDLISWRGGVESDRRNRVPP